MPRGGTIARMPRKNVTTGKLFNQKLVFLKDQTPEYKKSHNMSDTKYTLREVTDKQLEREFIDLPKRLYKGNPYWGMPP